MINRVRRSDYIPQGTGETAGLVVEDRSGRLVLDLGAADGRRYIDAAGYAEFDANFSVSNQDSGKTFVFNDGTASLVATLPKAAAENKGAKYTFVVNALAGAGAGHAVSPNVADTISFPGATPPTADKDVICSAATDRLGDSIVLQSDGVSNWFVLAHVGTWAREA